MHPRRTPCEDKRRDAVTSQGMPQIASKPAEVRGDSCNRFSKGTNPADTLILNFKPPKL